MMSQSPASDQSQLVAAQAERLSEYVKRSAVEGTPIHEVEQGIWECLLTMGREALGLYLSVQGSGDVGETIELETGEVLRRLPSLPVRSYQSVFGEFEIARCVYGSRVGQKIDFVPLDARLQLPESKFSYLLQDWSQGLAVDNAYAQVNATLSRILGLTQSSDSLERMNRQMSETVGCFEATHAVPPAAPAGNLIVASADGKGVPIRQRATTSTIAGHRPEKGPKPNRKKMAIVGAAYSVEPRVRTPQSVLDSLFRVPSDPSAAKPDTPQARPVDKHLRARLTVEMPESPARGSATDQIFEWLRTQVTQRQPTSSVPVIVLMDGQPSLWQAAQTYLPQSNAIEILDLLHVTSRIWQVVPFWDKAHSDEALLAVKVYVSLILQGQVDVIITVWRLLADSGTLKPKQEKCLRQVCNYFENNRHRMHYDQYLAAGYPIASGVIEGACRHLVKDRMERAGMQWTLQGAQAMLNLRSVALNQTWQAFTHFRIQHETERLYPHRNLLGAVDWPLFA
jgi:hypothetical protein